MSNDAYWFPHDSDARIDPKMVKLRMKKGIEGLGFFWCVIELLRSQEGYSCTLEDLELLAFDLRCESSMIDALFDSQLIEFCGNGLYHSASLSRRMEKWDEKRKRRADAGRKGGIAKAKRSNATKKNSNAMANAENNSGNALARREQNRREENITEENKTPKPPKGDSARFKSFWDAFGNKTGIDYARKCFEKAVKNGLPDSDTLVAIIHAQREQRAALKESGAFVPEWPNPSTWLNQGRWKDELPEVKKINWDGPNGDGIPF